MFDGAEQPRPATTTRRCSFCDRGEAEVFDLMDGHLAAICDACVERFQERLRDSKADLLCPVCRERYPRSGVVLLEHLRAVCYACVLVLAQQVVVPAARRQQNPTRPPASDGSDDELHCSFCDKRESRVERLFAGPNVYICDRCIATCSAHIRSDAAEQGRAPCPLCRRSVRLEEMVSLPQRRSLCLDCADVVAKHSTDPAP